MSTNPNRKKTEREALENLVAQFNGKITRVAAPKRSAPRLCSACRGFLNRKLQCLRCDNEAMANKP
jgi:hypothetical protein